MGERDGCSKQISKDEAETANAKFMNEPKENIAMKSHEEPEELEDNNDEEKQKELTDEQQQESQGPQGCSKKNGLRPQHASVPRPAGLVQDREELWRNQDVLTDMRPLTREPKTAPFGVGTQVFGAGCGEVSGSCKVPTGLPSAKHVDDGLRPRAEGLRPVHEETECLRTSGSVVDGCSAMIPTNPRATGVIGRAFVGQPTDYCEGEEHQQNAEAELSQNCKSSPPKILKKRIQETSKETDSHNLTAEVCGCAHSNGSPICGFVKANSDSQSHENAHSSGSPTCGHCSCTEPRSCTGTILALSLIHI